MALLRSAGSSDPARSRAHRLLAAALALLVALGPGLEAWAATVNWAQPVTGNASVAANWSPAQVPGSGDMATFHVGGGYTVTFDAAVPVTGYHIYRSGSVTLNSTNHVITTMLRVGELAGDAATMTHNFGFLRVGSEVVIGFMGGSTGTLNVNDNDADLVQSGTTADVFVGANGNGTLNVTGGGLVGAADDVFVGNNGQGTLLVSGVHPSPVARSTVSSAGADGDVVFGNNGSATATISAGAQILVADDAQIAVGPASQGSVTVEGGGNGFSSSLSVTGDLAIASNPLSATANGTGSLLVQNGGNATVGGTTRVGDPDGGTGTLSIRPSSFFTTGALEVNDVHGVLDHQGGTLTVNGGLFNPPGTTLTLDHLQFESVRLVNGATATFNGGSAAGYSLIVGETKSGGLRLEGGSILTHLNGVLSVGLTPGSNGVVDLSDSSSLGGGGTLVVGQGGFGELDVGGGSNLHLTTMYVALSPGSDGFVSVDGNGTSVTMGSLDVGGQGTAAGGDAFVGVTGGGVLSAVGSGATTMRLVHPGTTLQIGAGSIVNANNNFDCWGRLRMSDGQLNVGALNLQGAADLVGTGTVAGNVSVAAGALVHARDGILTLGDLNSNKGFSNSGTMIIDTATVTLRDSDGSPLGDVVMHSGNLTLAAGSSTVPSGKTMSGIGQVTGSLSNAGTISPGSSAGVISIRGPFAQTATGRLAMEIGDAATNQFDRLTCNGNITLGGTLDVSLLPGFAPDPGEEFTLITCSSRAGTFSSVTLDGQPVNGQFSILYNATSVVLHVNGITVDVPSHELQPGKVAFVGRSGAWSDVGFELALPEPAQVGVRLYAVSGQLVGTLADRQEEAGVARLRLSDLERKLSPGVYFGRATVRTAKAEFLRTAKVVVFR